MKDGIFRRRAAKFELALKGAPRGPAPRGSKNLLIINSHINIQIPLLLLIIIRKLTVNKLLIPEISL